MPRRSKRTTKSTGARASRGFRAVLTLLIVLAVGGTAAVRFLQTTRGGVFLVDHGVDIAYARVQSDVGVALRRSLEASGLRKRIRVRNDRATARSQDATRTPVHWDIPCDEHTDLLLVNVALTSAVKRAGARVRLAEETDHGRTLRFNVGTDTRDTHRLTIRRLEPPAVARALREAPPLPRVAIVIDDFGYAKGGVAGEILQLDLPLTISILPRLRFSQAVYAAARASRHCVMLHLPMEATEPYPQDLESISPEMSDAEIESIVGEYMESLPGVDGVNNHQGSRATADARVMRAVCGTLRPYGVFLLDSLTSPNSVAYNAAVAVGLRAASNSLFLDDATDRREDVEDRIRDLIGLARARGSAVGIGHPHPWTLEALRATADDFERAGVDLVPLCELVEAPSPVTRSQPQETP